MIVDSSALLAILLDEKGARPLLDALVDAPRPRMSVANWLDVAMLIEEKGGRLASLRFDPDADDMNLFTTLAHHPRLLKRWSAFGGLLLAGGTLPARDREVLICPPYTALHALSSLVQQTPIGLGAQDVFYEEQGAV